MGAAIIDSKALAATTEPRPQKGQGAEKPGASTPAWRSFW